MGHARNLPQICELKRLEIPDEARRGKRFRELGRINARLISGRVFPRASIVTLRIQLFTQRRPEFQRLSVNRSDLAQRLQLCEEHVRADFDTLTRPTDDPARERFLQPRPCSGARLGVPF